MKGPQWQATLVALYGVDKPPELVQLIHELQRELQRRLRERVRLYALEQIHATIIGLEARFASAGLCNFNFHDQRDEDRVVDLDRVLERARGLFADGIEIRIGGFKPSPSEATDCFGVSRSAASVGLARGIASVKGWSEQLDLYRARKSFEVAGVLHKFHTVEGTHEERPDNDFYFRVATLESRDGDETTDERAEREQALRELRTFLSQRDQIRVVLRPDDLRIVQYTDRQLPPESSVSYRLDDLDGDGLGGLYQDNVLQPLQD